MADRVYRVFVQWDNEARVFVAESEDVPGLVTEAETWNALIEKLRTLIPELLEENNGDDLAVVPWEAIWRDQSIRAQ